MQPRRVNILPIRVLRLESLCGAVLADSGLAALVVNQTPFGLLPEALDLLWIEPGQFELSRGSDSLNLLKALDELVTGAS